MKYLSYLIIRDTGENCKVDTIQAIRFENEMYSDNHQVSMKKWSELAKEKQKVKPTKETVELYLSNRVVIYYQQCIANLEKAKKLTKSHLVCKILQGNFINMLD